MTGVLYVIFELARSRTFSSVPVVSELIKGLISICIVPANASSLSAEEVVVASILEQFPDFSGK